MPRSLALFAGFVVVVAATGPTDGRSDERPVRRPLASAFRPVIHERAATGVGLPLIARAAGSLPKAPEAQHGTLTGHFPASKRKVNVVGRMRVHDAAPGRVSDVAAMGRYAYLGAFALPSCQDGGVYVIDISDPSDPREVGFIETAEGSFVGEGVQVLHIDTPAFDGDVLVHNNEICDPGAPAPVGGVSLWDVSDPLNPAPLALGMGDTTPAFGLPWAHEIHSAFAWDAGDRAFAALVDDYEFPDVDIMDITDPTNPVMIAETDIFDWLPDAILDGQIQMGQDPRFGLHDLTVKRVGGHWLMLLSYWDLGWVILNVDDPSSPFYVDDSTYRDPDPITGFSPPEGNAHTAEWDSRNEYIVGTDEDGDLFRATLTITTGPFQGATLEPILGDNTPVPPASPLAGPTVFVGQACSPPTSPAVPAPPSPGHIAVIEWGPSGCDSQQKLNNVLAAGYAGGIVFGDEATLSFTCEFWVFMGAQGPIPFVFVLRSEAYMILGINGYDDNNCPGGSNPSLPSIGAAGQRVDIAGVYDGWGYVRLLDAGTMAEIDALAPPPVLDPQFRSGVGTLTVHEPATDPAANLVYLSWYSLGFRVARFGAGGIQEVGHYIDRAGNDFWGVEVHRGPGGQRLLLASDRDSGLWIFRFTGCHQQGTSKRNELIGSRYADKLCGRGGNDTLEGRRGNDDLLGGTGNDVLKGGPGNDLLKGGPGVDVCHGGPGKDTFVDCEVRTG